MKRPQFRKVINLTGEVIHLSGSRGGDVQVTFQPSKQIARVKERLIKVGFFEGSPLRAVADVHVVNLPDAQEGVALLVTTEVRRACRYRKDLFTPDQPGELFGQEGLYLHYFGVVGND